MMGISWRYNQLESSWVILVTSHPLGRNLRYDRPVVMAPGNGKIFHRNINSLIFLDFPLPCCTDATIGWHHTSSIYIPNQQDTSPTIAWYYIPCWVATYVVCWLVDSEYSCWSEVTVGKPNLWLCLLLKVAILKHINT